MFPLDPNQPALSPRAAHVTRDSQAPSAPVEIMDTKRYYQAWSIGFDGAVALLNEDFWPTLADLDDSVHPEAFSYALDQIPEYEAPEISEAVHDGIAEAYRRYNRED
jgi:hypothetical protein